MTRKVKRLGCSAVKDILETNKLNIYDENTIMEISTFEARGTSYEASDGNHDDLMMNLVMFGFFATTDFFSDMTNIDIKQMMFKQKMKEITDDLPPFGHIDDAEDYIQTLEEQENSKVKWYIEYPDLHPD